MNLSRLVPGTGVIVEETIGEIYVDFVAMSVGYEDVGQSARRVGYLSPRRCVYRHANIKHQT